VSLFNNSPPTWENPLAEPLVLHAEAVVLRAELMVLEAELTVLFSCTISSLQTILIINHLQIKKRLLKSRGFFSAHKRATFPIMVLVFNIS